LNKKAIKKIGLMFMVGIMLHTIYLGLSGKIGGYEFVLVLLAQIVVFRVLFKLD